MVNKFKIMQMFQFCRNNNNNKNGKTMILSLGIYWKCRFKSLKLIKNLWSKCLKTKNCKQILIKLKVSNISNISVQEKYLWQKMVNLLLDELIKTVVTNCGTWEKKYKIPFVIISFRIFFLCSKASLTCFLSWNNSFLCSKFLSNPLSEL